MPWLFLDEKKVDYQIGQKIDTSVEISLVGCATLMKPLSNDDTTIPLLLFIFEWKKKNKSQDNFSYHIQTPHDVFLSYLNCKFCYFFLKLFQNIFFFCSKESLFFFSGGMRTKCHVKLWGSIIFTFCDNNNRGN